VKVGDRIPKARYGGGRRAALAGIHGGGHRVKLAVQVRCLPAGEQVGATAAGDEESSGKPEAAG
jgi:hypothetical protein